MGGDLQVGHSGDVITLPVLLHFVPPMSSSLSHLGQLNFSRGMDQAWLIIMEPVFSIAESDLWNGGALERGSGARLKILHFS